MNPSKHASARGGRAKSTACLLWCAVATLLSGCISQDLYRPLHVQTVPLKSEQVESLLADIGVKETPTTVPSLKRVRAKNATLSIMSGKGNFSGLHFSEAFMALKEFPENPFA